MMWRFWRRTQRERELEDEIAFDLAADAQERIRSGLSREEAEPSSRRDFGNTLLVKENVRATWSGASLDSFWRDIRATMRQLQRSPMFTVGAVIILSVALGLNIASLQVFDIAEFRPLAVRDAATFVNLTRLSRAGRGSSIPYPALTYIAAHSELFSALTVRRPALTLWEEDTSLPVNSAFVSANWFDELGSVATAGRLFRPELDERADSAPTIVVSHSFWKNRLHSDPFAVGQTFRINGHRSTLIGVAAEPSGLPAGVADIWLPVEQIDYFNSGDGFKDSWDSGMFVYARLRPGVTTNVVRKASEAVCNEIAQAHPESFHKGDRFAAYSAQDRFVNALSHWQDVLEYSCVSILALLVLAIACANLGNIVLSRSVSRLRELSIRVAMGASKLRVVTHLLAESLVLALLSLAGAFLFAYAGLRFASTEQDLPDVGLLTPDWRLMLAAAVAVLFVTGSLGLAPALKISRRNLIGCLNDGGQQMTSGLERTRLRFVLAGVQVAGACVLLMLAGLFVRGAERLNANPGYDVENLAVLTIPLNVYHPKGEEARTYWTRLRSEIARLPDTENVALVFGGPMGSGLTIWGTPDAPGLRITVDQVEPQYFEIMHIPLLAGRTFQDGDDREGTVIISKRVALQMYQTMDVIGRPFPKSSPDKVIVGLVDDALVVNPGDTEGGQQYVPIDWNVGARALVVRARNNIGRVTPVMAQAAAAIDNRFVPQVRLPRDDYAAQLRIRRLFGAAIGIPALLALILACVGIFGTVSYGVSLRQREIGIRVALGARPSAIQKLVVGRLLISLTTATLLGIALGVVANQIARSANPAATNLTPCDPATVAAITLLIAIASAAAILLPTRKALRTNVADTLRHE